MRACPRYIRSDLVLPDRSKINQADQFNWEMWSRSSCWRVPVSARFHGITERVRFDLLS